MQQLTGVVITIDGPSGVGKGTLAKELSLRLGCDLLDSGAIYRSLAFALLKQQISEKDAAAILHIAKTLDLSFQIVDSQIKVILENEDISTKIRTEEVGNLASKIAAIAEVREALLQRQRDFADSKFGLIADGRDMGTVVFPNAQVKIFLDASNAERANRRYKQLLQNNVQADYQQILTEIEERDYRDRHRAISPLVPADDALIIDSTSLNIQQVIDKALNHINNILSYG